MLVQGIVTHSFAAESGNKIIGIVPLKSNSISDNAEIVKDLMLELSKYKRIRIVDQKKLDAVLSYHNIKQTVDPKSDPLIVRARQAYYKMNYLEAKSLINMAITELRKSPSNVYENGQTLIDAYLTLGIIFKSMGNANEARQAFAEAVRLNPALTMDSRAYPPSYVRIFKDVKAALNLLPKGAIKVNSYPRVSEVFINGVIKGVTPLVINNLPEGEYFVKISADHYGEARTRLQVKSGKVTKFYQKLAWLGADENQIAKPFYLNNKTELEQIEDALKAADLLKLDNVLIVSKENDEIETRVIDAKLKASMKPIISTNIVEVAGKIKSLIIADVKLQPQKYLDPVGKSEPSVMVSYKQGKKKRTITWAIIGGAVAIGVGAGIAAALASSGSGNINTGSLNLMFK